MIGATPHATLAKAHKAVVVASGRAAKAHSFLVEDMTGGSGNPKIVNAYDAAVTDYAKAIHVWAEAWADVHVAPRTHR